MIKPGLSYSGLHVRLPLFLIFLVCMGGNAFSQLFPGLEGEELEEAIRNNYTPGYLLDDTQVKDTLYARIFIQGDSVHCIYSGMARFLPSGVDPSQWLYGTGLETESINLEHSWPQAKGAGDGTNGNMDMHHLFPSRSAINSDRANYPYAEIEDALTQKWYYLGNEMSTKPSNNIAVYSEYRTGSFEPRESVKGDIARAMLYFWTIYRQDAIAADPFYFDLMKDQLCQWHEQDPADDFENLRNERIATYQDGKQNPFILDCSLAKRTYCNTLPECEMVSSGLVVPADFRIFYNPSDHQLTVQGSEDRIWKLSIFNVTGEVIQVEMVRTNWNSSLKPRCSGFFIAYAVQDQKVLIHKFFVP